MIRLYDYVIKCDDRGVDWRGVALRFYDRRRKRTVVRRLEHCTVERWDRSGAFVTLLGKDSLGRNIRIFTSTLVGNTVTGVRTLPSGCARNPVLTVVDIEAVG